MNCRFHKLRPIYPLSNLPILTHAFPQTEDDHLSNNINALPQQCHRLEIAKELPLHASKLYLHKHETIALGIRVEIRN